MNATQVLSPSFEDYLEAIYTLITQYKFARSKDIAAKLKVKRPSVTGALKALAEKGLVHYEPHAYIALTPEGEKIARCVDKRHHVLMDLFTGILKLSWTDAEEAACRMEHGMNTNACKALRSMLLAVHNDPELAQKLQDGIAVEKNNLACDNLCEYSTARKEDGEMIATTENLNTLSTGESGAIVKIEGSENLKKRLRELGITAGQEVRIMKSAPLDDPIEIKVRNYNISLRREEADHIIINR
jgi:DtxR family transcriptional regulator, Mn-dependent transcriptional regulator